MGYASLQQCLVDLERHGHLRRIDAPIDAYLEAAAIHRRVYAAGGPALLFANVVGCRFPMASNLFGTIERARFMFRDAYESVRKLVAMKADPAAALKSPIASATAALAARHMPPKLVRSGPVMTNQTTISQLPQLVSWPRDGGAFVTLPQVYTEDPRAPGLGQANLGMYRIQLSGGEYQQNAEIGLHYQLHRSIGVHQAAAMRAGQPFRVNVFVGGPPAMNLAAVMPLPEGMSELTFAGALGARRVRMVRCTEGLPVHADTDFAIRGTVIDGKMLPEGPFGDHLGYYSLQHPFPVLKVENVYHRDDAVWPFTVVGRPPQEDTAFGQLIHDLTGPVIPTVLPGVDGVHAVDAAGVHPLLLAIGSERYMPFMQGKRPQELLTQACAILGQGQLSLAKFLLIAARDDDPRLNLHDIRAFFRHVLQRVDWKRDLHFHTQTTIDTLDYTGDAINAGSKLVVAAVGPPVHELSTVVDHRLRLPDGFADPQVVMPGVLAVRGPKCPAPSFDYDASRRDPSLGSAVEEQGLSTLRDSLRQQMKLFCGAIDRENSIRRFRLIIVCDNPRFLSENLDNFLWATFTRANPAADVHGIGSFTQEKHWGCQGPLVIDARVKPHHAPVLEEDPRVTTKIESLAAAGGPLDGLF